ncbi:hypothetical protein NEAUS04_0910 [Nematocida ausubeli]|uniref:Uncharacterized protein n=1 Tax=Nematocida ausubeli (strain ATCC PRA-371 / ERTm2) TaxID=1913371 RepID=H8ZA82_NEMA1|nr:uncharacterized protein NESG_00608 [Nematocida ausubeli]EHY66863.1 hypothetical protein NERG_00503 [Nematocida ausubeli]KAI5135138.1 hypothetical protein NEAUS07_1021 [Nematocida ausubeli]KAI5147923.1 hypothetical protein NEAUS05_1197 [Nematocida ausubeli]KAI5162157.1 hypothetical protein NEAUS04_0910 [Nematocida ausubeli]KFG26462.1 hypothetical protein NESG_00608 [Nematocida ausubeli]
MKIQLESIEAFEDIFKEILGSDETAKHTQNELNVLMHIKNLFLKNVEIGGEELDIGQVTQEKLERKKEHAKLIAEVEEAEKNKSEALNTLCNLRRELPHTLREEVSERCTEVIRQMNYKPAHATIPQKAPAPEEDVTRIKSTVNELSEKLPVVLSQIKEKISYVEKEVKERIDQKGREIETEALSILFKDELEMPE